MRYGTDIKPAMLFTIMIATLLCAGCAVGPDYSEPETPRDMARWDAALEAGLMVSQADISQWWQRLNDSKLNKLVVRALSGNLDLDQARSRVREARAGRGVVSAARFPTVSVSGSAAKTKQADLQAREIYAAGFDAAWEIDIFGGVSRNIEAATADMHASVEAFRSIQVSLVAEIALNYVEVRAFQNRLRLAKANVKAQEKTFAVVMVRFDTQLSDALAVQQAKFNLSSSRAKIPPLETGLKQAMNRLAVLTGEKPGALHNVLQEGAPVPTAPLEIAVGIPADLIRRRPDIRKAERELAAQSARVGVAMAELYPHFSFSGVLQFQTADASNLFSTMSRLLSIGPAFRWNIFNAGSVRSNIRVQNERHKQSLIGYERSVLIALEEVENAMVAYARELDRREFLEQAAAASQKSANLAESLYKDGLKDFIHVLDAQRAQ
ncbi:MAG: efflux transporter outer membrane subunit, partial [Deltaproteobacteria bacterium]|nr:efflux transporter outer membrane subunit [Deltaproteobacteria bacterium]